MNNSNFAGLIINALINKESCLEYMWSARVNLGGFNVHSNYVPVSLWSIKLVSRECLDDSSQLLHDQIP